MLAEQSLKSMESKLKKLEKLGNCRIDKEMRSQIEERLRDATVKNHTMFADVEEEQDVI